MKNRKSIFSALIIVLVLQFYSCKKEDTKPCNCGRIISDNVSDYSVVIRNECTGNEKRFYLQPGDWMNAYVGKDFCISNTGKW